MEFSKIKTPEELLEYMSRNIKYGFVGKNGKIYDNPSSSDWNEWFDVCYVQVGEEVLQSMVGTCWDQVELERLWFKNNNYKYKTFFIEFNTDNKDELPTHTFLLFNRNNKWYWFENAFEDYRGIHEFNSIEEAIRFVKEKQFEYAYKNGYVTNNIKDKIISSEYLSIPSKLDVNGYLEFVRNNEFIKTNK